MWGVVGYQRESGTTGRAAGPLPHRKPHDGACRRQEVRHQQIHGTQGPFRAAAPLQPGAVAAGEGDPGREQGPAPYPGRHGHPAEVQRRIKEGRSTSVPLFYCRKSVPLFRGGLQPTPRTHGTSPGVPFAHCVV